MEQFKNFEEKILAYLRAQEEYPENSYTFTNTPNLNYDTDDENHEEFYKNQYERINKKHNQCDLFELEQVLPDITIDEDIYEQLAFSETLVISKLMDTSKPEIKEPIPVGGLILNIQSMLTLPKKKHKEINYMPEQISDSTTNVESNHDEQNEWLENKLNDYEQYLVNQMNKIKRKYIVHLSSHFHDDETEVGSQISSWVDRKFHTLEEKRTEYVKPTNSGKVHEKSLYVALENNKYFIKHADNKEGIGIKKHYSLKRTCMLIGEGASFLLMRLLAINRFMGTFELSTLYINGDLCRNIYCSDGPYSEIVNGRKLDVCKIYRTIIEECGNEHHSVTVLTLTGQIISQEWRDCDFILNINPLIIIENDKINVYERTSLNVSWKDDLQLFSMYLDQKDNLTSEFKTYLKDHQEVRKLISDYVQTILQIKPKDILTFTIQYFANYERLPMPNTSMFIPRSKYLTEDSDSDTKIHYSI